MNKLGNNIIERAVLHKLGFAFLFHNSKNQLKERTTSNETYYLFTVNYYETAMKRRQLLIYIIMNEKQYIIKITRVIDV